MYTTCCCGRVPTARHDGLRGSSSKHCGAMSDRSVPPRLGASNAPDVLANGYVPEADYPAHGKRLKVHGSPWHFSTTPAQLGTAPGLCEHNDAVLADSGTAAALI